MGLLPSLKQLSFSIVYASMFIRDLLKLNRYLIMGSRLCHCTNPLASSGLILLPTVGFLLLSLQRSS